MDEFCGGPFWNTSLLLENTWPQLTTCFLDIVVTCAPCVIFWLVIPCHVYMTESTRIEVRYSFRVSHLNMAKLVCVSVLCVLAGLQLLERVSSADHRTSAAVLGCGVLLLTMVAATLMTQYERWRCIMTSGPLFVFWLLKTTCDVIPFYTKIMMLEPERELEDFVRFVLAFALTVTTTVLYAFSDPVAVSKINPAGENPCPENTASFLNRLMFAWLNKLILLGYRRGVEMTDLWSLPPHHQSSTLVPAFERLWSQEVLRCSRRNTRSTIRFHIGHAMAGRSCTSANGAPDEHTPLMANGNPRNHLRQNGTAESALGRTRYISNSYESNKTWYESDETEAERVSLNEDDDQGGLTNDDKERARPSLVRVLVRQFGGPMAICMLQKIVSDTCVVCSPIVLGLLIGHLNAREAGREWQGYTLAVALLLLGTIRTAFYACGNYDSYLLGLQVKSVIIGAVFNKALRINNEARKKTTTGEMVSLISVDAQRMTEFFSRFYFGMGVPFVLLASAVVLYSYVAAAAFAGAIVVAGFLLITVLVGMGQQLVQEKLLVFKDLRIKIFNEILNGIKVLKLYAWEVSFERRVSEVRSQEVRCFVRIAWLYALLGLCTNMLAFMMTLATFGWYVLAQSSNFLDPSAAFVIMSLLSVLSPALDSLSITISFFVQAKVSVKRINDFLCSPDLDFDTVTLLNNHDESIRVENASFTWDNSTYPTLTNINLTMGTGRVVAVVGPVGAGKSSLVSCLLGEMAKLHGTVAVKGTVAYVAQQAWIQNATVRDNVLFGLPYQRDRYNAVVKACQLDRDLSLLQAGDLTEIGEKGTNLSGGQKQRVSLARAVYSDRDLYLLDDPLSAVDSHVGKAIFRDVIGPKGVLKGKTRVLVTHGVHWLPLVDEIVVMRQGRIREAGSYTQLLQANGDFALFLKTYFTQQENDDDDNDGIPEDEEEQSDPEVLEMRRKVFADVSTATEGHTSGDDIQLRLSGLPPRRKKIRKERAKRQRKPGHKSRSRYEYEDQDALIGEQGKLITSENIVKGRVPMQIYLHYSRAAGLVPVCLAALCFGAFRASGVLASFWLRRWTDDPVLTNQTAWGSEAFVTTNHYYLAGYGLFGLLQVVLLLVYNALHWMRTIRASRQLHDRMIRRLFRAPMNFFDTIPIGRIMNRISFDMETVDNLMPLIVRDLVSVFSQLVASVVVFVVVSPTSSAVLLPLFVVGYFVVVSYVPTSRQCRRMEAVTRSPIFAHCSETMTGGATIRAYRATERFIAESKRRVDGNQKFYFTWVAGLRWCQMILDAMSNVVVFAAAMLELVSTNPSGGSVGLSVSYALQLTFTLNYLMRQVTDFETNVVSIERIKEYSELPSEAPWVNELRRPIPDWPTRGRVELKDYQTRYRPGLELVLKNVTCEIQGGEKIGIVGRTGAGKSSLSLALFRLIEGTGGAILIDGVNIADLGLHDLRARLTILPQDPVLFSGSLRFNLDPFGEFSDDALWQALEQAHIKDFVQGLPGDLGYECEEEGLNLSVGQRQLVCLARTLLRKTRVLVLDEATAAVDMETDALIQRTVRQAFSACTVLCIAHRLNTVRDYDRIMVLDSGTVHEFDTPSNLLARPDSVFAAMLRDAGLA